jgi:hypothetical protein
MKNKPIYDDRITFGKYEGEKISELPVSYCQWFEDNYDFSNNYNPRDKHLRDEIFTMAYFDEGRLRREFDGGGSKKIIGSLIVLYRKITGQSGWLPPLIK